MIGVTELKSGTTFEEDGNIFVVLSYEHIKMGRGSANIKVKVKSLRSGSITEKSFINGARVKDVMLLKKQLQYLYKDEDGVYFMDPTTFEQVSIPLKIAIEHQYFKEGETLTVSFLGNEALSVSLPPKMDFVVAETAPAFKGNSATNVFKDAILENGMKIKVPPFIKIGEKVRIDTRSGAYTEKA